MIMRISTTMLYDMAASRISEAHGTMAKTQQQVSTGRRILAPSDDPIGSARALELTQGKSVNEQFAINRQHAKNLLAQEEGALSDVTKLVQDVQTLVVQAGNATLADEQRRYIATELQGHFEQLLSLANSKDGTGNYMFGGYNVKAAPFSATANGAVYQGDQGQRMLQIDATRQIALSDSGANIFERVRTGNGTFVTAPASANQGTGVISAGSVTDPTALTGHQYRLVFTVAADVTTYDVFDDTVDPTTPVSAGNAFVAGEAIGFDGLQFDIKGTPANNDVFTVNPSSNESIFTTLKDLIVALNQPAQSPAARASLQNSLIEAGGELASMLESVLTVRASLGMRMQEVERLDDSGLDRELFYAEALSDLQDLDYVKALSDLSRQKVMLEAAQKTFVTVSGMSLFKML
jgi:flagellar hook-associated protein 3 FlgL